MKPVSSKLYMSLSVMLYLAFVLATSSNRGVITRGSLLRARWRLYRQLLRSLTSGVRVLKLSTQCLLTGSLPRSASRSLAISRTIAFVAGIPCVSSSSIHCTSASSSSLLSFFKIGSRSRQERTPWRQSLRVLRGTLKAVITRLSLLSRSSIVA
jgi:hypothetical protein